MKDKFNAKLSISRPHYGDGSKFIEIRVEDEDAGIQFLALKVSYDKFAEALTGLGLISCIAEVYELENVGMKIERTVLEFPLPDDVPEYTGKTEKVIELVKEVCPKGWKAETYFGSQNSFFTKDKIRYARCTIRRWVEKE